MFIFLSKVLFPDLFRVSGAHMQILIAEDNPINQKLVDLICRKAGYQTRIVPDGSTAVDAIREGGIGLGLWLGWGPRGMLT